MHQCIKPTMHYSAWQHGALSVTENNTNSLKKLKQVFSLKQIPNVYMFTLCQLKVITSSWRPELPSCPLALRPCDPLSPPIWQESMSDGWAFRSRIGSEHKTTKTKVMVAFLVLSPQTALCEALKLWLVQILPIGSEHKTTRKCILLYHLRLHLWLLRLLWQPLLAETRQASGSCVSANSTFFFFLPCCMNKQT